MGAGPDLTTRSCSGHRSTAAERDVAIISSPAARQRREQDNRVAVVIPYYQMQPGILARTLRSVLAQDDSIDLRVLIVDDGSPVPARDELARVVSPRTGCVSILEQRNRGAAVARNRGLAQVPPEFTYVAFIDSDDTWAPDHLSNALSALNQGFDFYFADFMPLMGEGTFFAQRDFTSNDHATLIPGRPLHSYGGDFFDQGVRKHLVHPSTVVYRYRSMHSLRFLPAYQRVGEDLIFWMTVAKATSKVAFSEACEAYCGRGVNIYWSSVDVRDEGVMRRVYHEMRFRMAVPDIFVLDDRQMRSNDDQLLSLREQLVRAMSVRLRDGRLSELAYVFLYVIRDPRVLATIWQKVRRKLSAP